MDLNNINTLKTIIAPHILDVGAVPLIKEALIYQLFADRLNFFCIGSAGSGAKSSYRYSIMKLIPDNFDFVTPTGLTNVGLREVAMSFPDWGILSVDEMDKLAGDDIKCLLDIMQFQTVKITKHDHNEEYRAPISIFAIANPKGNNNEWRNWGNPQSMKEQMPFGASMLRRFHFTLFTRSYTEDEFDKINRFIANNKINDVNYSDGFKEQMTEYIVNARSIEIDLNRQKVPERIFQFLKNVKRIEHHLISPITPELCRGVVQIALSKARIRLSNEIEDEDWSSTMEFLLKCLHTAGLHPRLLNSLKK